jgi:outer membrane receptor protein involved in Fe transport
VDSREVAFDYRLRGKASLAGSFHRNRIRDMIAPEADAATGLQQHHNTGGARTEGAEFEFRSQYEALSLRTSVSWQRGRHDNGAELANAPRLLGKLLLALPLPAGLSFSWETRVTGKRTGDSGSASVAGTPVGSSAVSHATLAGVAAGAMDWQLRLSNVFDRTYGDVIGTEFSSAFPGAMASPMPTMEQDGRALFLRLRWKL